MTGWLGLNERIYTPMATEIPSRFEDIRKIFDHLPGPDLGAATLVAQREAQLTKPAGSLGRLEEITSWMAKWQGSATPRADHPRVAVFAANHGVCDQGVSAFPQAVTAQMVANFVGQGAAVNQLCALVDADLRVYEMQLDEPTKDFSLEPAMSEEDCARAIAYGMMAVDEEIDLLCLGEMGIGNTTAAAALALALFGGTAADWTGAGTGVAGADLQRKTDVVQRSVELHKPDMTDPLEILRRVGGRELAAICGAILAARMAKVPVLIDGFICTAAAAVLEKAHPGALDHCMVAHQSAEQAHARLCEALGKRPLLQLDMRLGEASGATLAVALVKAALATHAGMATFEEAAVSNRDAS